MTCLRRMAVCHSHRLCNSALQYTMCRRLTLTQGRSKILVLWCSTNGENLTIENAGEDPCCGRV